ncbi:MAG: hypothetical protein KDB60_10030 [Propionibacteriaceae bacterium]|nr:hypothetical protein [Propionibacteriaceae bacterium]
MARQTRRFFLADPATERYVHLFSMGPISDGGIIFMPQSQSGPGWRTFSRIDGSQAHQPQVAAPKVHYHRSGFVSVQTAGGQRQSRQLPGLDQAHRKQILCLHQLHPLDTCPRRNVEALVDAGDMLLTQDLPQDPFSITIQAIIYQTGEIRLRDLDTPAFGDVRGFGLGRDSRGEEGFTLNLADFGLDALLYCCPIYEFEERQPGLATTTVFGSCYAPGDEQFAVPTAVGAFSDDGTAALMLVNAEDVPPARDVKAMFFPRNT